ncbi:hypothetical protein CSPX01_04734 [Colletotrichum filicis]|nr:hypothetical protein CSPX01_04734 [Colletotrichum filicis]
MTSKPAPHSCPLSPRLPPVCRCRCPGGQVQRARASCKHRRSQGRPRCKPPLHKFTGSNVQGRTVVPPLCRCSFFHIHKHLLIAIHCTLIAP